MKLTLSLLGIVGGSLLDACHAEHLGTSAHGIDPAWATRPRHGRNRKPAQRGKLRAFNKALASDPPATLSGVKVKDSPDYKNVKLLAISTSRSSTG